MAGRRVVAASAGAHDSFAITAEGGVWSWGWGHSGLGHGGVQNQLLPEKIDAFAGQRVVAVSAGDIHSIAITADGSIWSWDEGFFGQLGHGNEQNQLLPKNWLGGASSPCRLDPPIASSSPPMAASGAGAMEPMAG